MERTNEKTHHGLALDVALLLLGGHLRHDLLVVALVVGLVVAEDVVALGRPREDVAPVQRVDPLAGGEARVVLDDLGGVGAVGEAVDDGLDERVLLRRLGLGDAPLVVRHARGPRREGRRRRRRRRRGLGHVGQMFNRVQASGSQRFS
jgi:hypothetical protein